MTAALQRAEMRNEVPDPDPVRCEAFVLREDEEGDNKLSVLRKNIMEWISWQGECELRRHSYCFKTESGGNIFTIRHVDCQQQVVVKDRDDVPICAECQKIGDQNGIRRTVLKHVRKKFAAELLHAKLFCVRWEGGANEVWDEETCYLQTPQPVLRHGHGFAYPWAPDMGAQKFPVHDWESQECPVPQLHGHNGRALHADQCPCRLADKAPDCSSSDSFHKLLGERGSSHRGPHQRWDCPSQLVREVAEPSPASGPHLELSQNAWPWGERSANGWPRWWILPAIHRRGAISRARGWQSACNLGVQQAHPAEVRLKVQATASRLDRQWLADTNASVANCRGGARQHDSDRPATVSCNGNFWLRPVKIDYLFSSFLIYLSGFWMVLECFG